VPWLQAFKPPPPLEPIFPRQGPLDTHASRMDRFVEQPLAPTLGGVAMTMILFELIARLR